MNHSLYRMVRPLGAALSLCLAVSACQQFLPAQTASSALAAAPVPASANSQDVDQLLHLIGMRLAVAEQVAQAKWNSGAPIDDPVREGQILDGLTASLPALDAHDKAAVRQFFQDQFDAGKLIQFALHAKWRSQQHAPFANPPDLARDIRPQLDRLTPQLLAALDRLRPILAHADAQTRMLIRARAQLDLPELDPVVRDKALASLLAQ